MLLKDSTKQGPIQQQFADQRKQNKVKLILIPIVHKLLVIIQDLNKREQQESDQQTKERHPDKPWGTAISRNSAEEITSQNAPLSSKQDKPTDHRRTTLDPLVLTHIEFEEITMPLQHHIANNSKQKHQIYVSNSTQLGNNPRHECRSDRIFNPSDHIDAILNVSCIPRASETSDIVVLAR